MSSIFVVMGETFVGWQLAFKWGAKEERSNCNYHVLAIYAQKQACAHAYKALEMPMGHAHLISCDLSFMGAWNVRSPHYHYQLLFSILMRL